MNPSVTSKFALLLIATGLLCLVPAIPAAPMLVPGFVRFEVYTNLPGASIGDLVFAPEYPDSPGRTFYTTALDTRTVYPTDSHENYGGRLTGFLVPTATADYIFFLRGQDACQLFLSPDDDPANLELIAEDEVGGGGFEEPGVPKTSAPRSLVAGQRYAIQVLYKAGVGPDLCQVAWRTTESTTPAAELTPIPGTFLAALIEPRGNVTITRQPTGATLGANQSLTLDVDFTTTHGPIFVQWQKDGANVPGRVGGTVSLGPLTESDSGSYRAVVSIPGAVAISSAVNVTVTPDVTPPTIRRIVVADSLESITVEYSEAVTDTALDVFNYALDGGQQITGDGVRVNPSTVRFGTTRLTIGATYTLTVTDIEDLAGLTSAPGTSRTFTLTRERGGLKFEAWLNLGGNAVSALLSHPAYPDNPDLVAYVTQASSRQVFADAASVDNYGGRLSGWIVPPESGDYEFFIRSDDNSELYLSPDDNPANAVLIASESGCCGPFEEPGAPETSTPQTLEGGRAYYIQALWKEGGGGDYCDVAWRKVGTPGLARDLAYIAGDVLEAFAPPGTFTAPTVAFTSPANEAEFAATDAVTLNVRASASAPKNIVKVEFFEQGRVIGTVSNTPYSLTLHELREDKHTFIARATDSAGLIKDSAPIDVYVGPRVATVTLTAINDTFTWRYNRGGVDLGTEWRQPEYDDSTWPEGKMLIADESTTTVEPIRTRINRFNDQGQYVQTFYFRTRFVLNGPITPAVKLRLRHVVDDGVAFYLNGAEIHRFGLGSGDIFYSTSAAGHENAYEGPYDIPTANLREGENVLAAEVHQAGGSSSDMVFGAELIATIPVIRARLHIARQGDLARISWSPAGGTLESAPSPDGPWTEVDNATNPMDVTASGTARFYRVRR